LILFFSLGTIVSIGSAISLGVFLLVGVAGLRLRHEITAHVSLIVAAIVSCAVALGFFVVDTLWGDPRAFWTTVGLIAGAIVIDAAWKRASSKRVQDAAAPQPS
jgi:hypothetical protein